MAARVEPRVLYGIDDLDHTGALRVRRLHVVPPLTVHLAGLDGVRAVLQPAVDAVDVDRPLGVAGEFGCGIDELEPETDADCDAFEAYADRVVTLCGGESDAAPQVRADGGMNDERGRRALRRSFDVLAERLRRRWSVSTSENPQ
ncbi:hypothetical protein [Halomicrobium katesii]|uniref:hypothetical protein n=1 Tax=Halomicrobium katesii TaxID=437163 RepID=UPI000379949E|nr:hypothetical protein [Halomicrobium katesii]